jgi:hypothetical protein
MAILITIGVIVIVFLIVKAIDNSMSSVDCACNLRVNNKRATLIQEYTCDNCFRRDSCPDSTKQGAILHRLEYNVAPDCYVPLDSTLDILQMVDVAMSMDTVQSDVSSDYSNASDIQDNESEDCSSDCSCGSCSCDSSSDYCSSGCDCSSSCDCGGCD